MRKMPTDRLPLWILNPGVSSDMYLIDEEIRELLPTLNIETGSADHPFIPEDQIQPCSIDIRLSNVFWLPESRRTKIDLRRAQLAEISPRRHWTKVNLGLNECYTIRPGDILLGRTHEKFSMPENCAGRIDGRSSFARMGLSVQCSAGFINPGWRGHMPLQLVNLGPHPIKIFPLIPVCQLMVSKLSARPSKIYGEEELQSKYMDDDGGPSYWWRDKRIGKLHAALEKVHIALAIQQSVIETIGIQEPEILERFEKYIDTTHVSELDGSAELLAAFAQSEDSTRFKDKLKKWWPTALLAISGGLSLKYVFEPPHPWFHFLVWVIAVVSILMIVRLLRMSDHEYLGARELGVLQRAKQGVSV